MPGRAPEPVCRLRQAPVRQGSPCRDGLSITGEGTKVSHQLGDSIESGLGNKAINILTQTCEKESRNYIRALMNTFAHRKISKYIFTYLFWRWW